MVVKMPKEENYPVIIKWIDAWQSLDKRCSLDQAMADGQNGLRRTQIGFLLERTEDYVVFTVGFLDWVEEGRTVDQLHRIPTSMIVEIIYLKEHAI